MHSNVPKKPSTSALLSLSAYLALLITATPSTAYASEQDYLDAITLEAEKVEQRRLGDKADANDPDSTATQLPPTAPAAIRTGVSLKEFEAKLARDYRGTHTFYTKLTQRSKEEIFESYINGSDMDKLRQKVITRYNHENSKK